MWRYEKKKEIKMTLNFLIRENRRINLLLVRMQNTRRNRVGKKNQVFLLNISLRWLITPPSRDVDYRASY